MELAVKTGEKVLIVNAESADWTWCSKDSGVQGWVPRAYLDVDENQERRTTELPDWLKTGQECQWWSKANECYYDVTVTEIDKKTEELKVVFAIDSSSFKIVPFSHFEKPQEEWRLRPHEDKAKELRLQLPEWVKAGGSGSWWSTGQKRCFPVTIKDVNSKSRRVFVTFDSDKKCKKSVPFHELIDDPEKCLLQASKKGHACRMPKKKSGDSADTDAAHHSPTKPADAFERTFGKSGLTMGDLIKSICCDVGDLVGTDKEELERVLEEKPQEGAGETEEAQGVKTSPQHMPSPRFGFGSKLASAGGLGPAIPLGDSAGKTAAAAAPAETGVLGSAFATLGEAVLDTFFARPKTPEAGLPSGATAGASRTSSPTKAQLAREDQEAPAFGGAAPAAPVLELPPPPPIVLEPESGTSPRFGESHSKPAVGGTAVADPISLGADDLAASAAHRAAAHGSSPDKSAAASLSTHAAATQHGGANAAGRTTSSPVFGGLAAGHAGSASLAESGTAAGLHAGGSATLPAEQQRAFLTGNDAQSQAFASEVANLEPRFNRTSDTVDFMLASMVDDESPLVLPDSRQPSAEEDKAAVSAGVAAASGASMTHSMSSATGAGSAGRQPKQLESVGGPAAAVDYSSPPRPQRALDAAWGVTATPGDAPAAAAFGAAADRSPAVRQDLSEQLLEASPAFSLPPPPPPLAARGDSGHGSPTTGPHGDDVQPPPVAVAGMPPPPAAPFPYANPAPEGASADDEEVSGAQHVQSKAERFNKEREYTGSESELLLQLEATAGAAASPEASEAAPLEAQAEAKAERSRAMPAARPSPRVDSMAEFDSIMQELAEDPTLPDAQPVGSQRRAAEHEVARDGASGGARADPDAVASNARHAASPGDAWGSSAASTAQATAPPAQQPAAKAQAEAERSPAGAWASVPTRGHQGRESVSGNMAAEDFDDIPTATMNHLQPPGSLGSGLTDDELQPEISKSPTTLLAELDDIGTPLPMERIQEAKLRPPPPQPSAAAAWGSQAPPPPGSPAAPAAWGQDSAAAGATPTKPAAAAPAQIGRVTSEVVIASEPTSPAAQDASPIAEKSAAVAAAGAGPEGAAAQGAALNAWGSSPKAKAKGDWRKQVAEKKAQQAAAEGGEGGPAKESWAQKARRPAVEKKPSQDAPSPAQRPLPEGGEAAEGESLPQETVEERCLREALDVLDAEGWDSETEPGRRTHDLPNLLANWRGIDHEFQRMMGKQHEVFDNALKDEMEESNRKVDAKRESIQEKLEARARNAEWSQDQATAQKIRTMAWGVNSTAEAFKEKTYKAKPARLGLRDRRGAKRKEVLRNALEGKNDISVMGLVAVEKQQLQELTPSWALAEVSDTVLAVTRVLEAAALRPQDQGLDTHGLQDKEANMHGFEGKALLLDIQQNASEAVRLTMESVIAKVKQELGCVSGPDEALEKAMQDTKKMSKEELRDRKMHEGQQEFEYSQKMNAKVTAKRNRQKTLNDDALERVKKVLKRRCKRHRDQVRGQSLKDLGELKAAVADAREALRRVRVSYEEAAEVEAQQLQEERRRTQGQIQVLVSAAMAIREEKELMSKSLDKDPKQKKKDFIKILRRVRRLSADLKSLEVMTELKQKQSVLLYSLRMLDSRLSAECPGCDHEIEDGPIKQTEEQKKQVEEAAQFFEEQLESDIADIRAAHRMQADKAVKEAATQHMMHISQKNSASLQRARSAIKAMAQADWLAEYAPSVLQPFFDAAERLSAETVRQEQIETAPSDPSGFGPSAKWMNKGLEQTLNALEEINDMVAAAPAKVPSKTDEKWNQAIASADKVWRNFCDDHEGSPDSPKSGRGAESPQHESGRPGKSHVEGLREALQIDDMDDEPKRPPTKTFMASPISPNAGSPGSGKAAGGDLGAKGKDVLSQLDELTKKMDSLCGTKSSRRKNALNASGPLPSSKPALPFSKRR
eukprot:TRINITY_DN25189_c0_g1_i2.p1 TRINITY_DN25189_c0_g1~~TRINITY_DN25189_c0_g1_i2.p1  ORF type:complete len:2284 (-),score=716.39 TRINITY_DN25189_c0_g1_i2:201-6038(-)